MGLKTKGLLDSQVWVKNPTTTTKKLERWYLGGSGYFLLFLKTQLWFPAPTQIPGTVKEWEAQQDPGSAFPDSLWRLARLTLSWQTPHSYVSSFPIPTLVVLGAHCQACRSMCTAASPKTVVKGSWSWRCCHCSGRGAWPQVQWCGIVSVCALGHFKLSDSILCSRSPGLFPVGE